MVLDIITVVIILALFIAGLKKGAAHTLISILVSFISYITASFLGQYISELIYSNYIANAVTDSITSTLSQSSVGITQAIDTISLPLIARLALAFSGFDTESAFQQAILDAPTAIASGVESAIKPVVVSFLSFAMTILLLIIVSLILKFTVAKALLKCFRINGLRQLNTALGGVGGLLSGFILVSFLAYLLRLIIPYVNNIPEVFSESQIYNSYIFYYFYSGNIFSAIISI